MANILYLLVVKNIKKRFPKLRLYFADGGYSGPKVEEYSKAEKVRVKIVKRDKIKEFKVLPKRWIVERSFAWLEGARRLAKDYELLDKTQVSFINMQFIKIIINRITKNNI